MTTPLEQLAEILADNSELEIVKKHGLMWIYTDPHELAQAIIDAGWTGPAEL